MENNYRRICFLILLSTCFILLVPSAFGQSFGPPKILFGSSIYGFQYNDTDGFGNSFDFYDGGLTVDSSGILRSGTGYVSVSSFDYTAGGGGWGGQAFGLAGDGWGVLGIYPGVLLLAHDYSDTILNSQSSGLLGQSIYSYPNYVGLPTFLNGTTWVAAYITDQYGGNPNTFFQFGSSPVYWYGGSNMVIDDRSGWPASNFLDGVPQQIYLNGRVFTFAGVGGYIDQNVNYSDYVYYTSAGTSAWVQIDRFYSNGAGQGGFLVGDVGGASFGVSFDLGSWQVGELPSGIAVSFSAPSGYPAHGPPLVSWDGNLLRFYYTTVDGRDLYWFADGVSGLDYSVIIAADNSVTALHDTVSIAGTYSVTSSKFDFSGDIRAKNLFALDANGNPMGLPVGLTMLLNAGGFGDSVLLSDGVHMPTYTYRRPDGSWGEKYVGLSENCWFLIADNAGNYNSQLYITQNGEMVVNAIGGWPVANSYPSQVYVNGVSCPLHWDTNYVGGTGQSTYGGASYISADNSKTVTLSWAWGLSHRFIGVAEYLVNGDVEEFRRELIASAQCRLELLNRFESGGDVSPSYAAMTGGYKALLDALAAANDKLGFELASRIGGREAIEKENDHPFDLSFGYALKAAVLQASDLGQRLRVFADKVSEAQNRDFVGYANALAIIGSDEDRDVGSTFAAILEGHKKQSKGNGVFKGTEDESLCVWGVAVANLLISRGVSVDVDDPILPGALLRQLS